MSVKGGQILHVAGNDAGSAFLIDRIQTGGLTGINVNETKIDELGNYETVGTVRDIPDLTFEIESFDTSTELESILTGGDNTEANGTEFNLANFVPIDILSPFKTSGLFTIAGGVIIPYLSLESMSYRFSITDSAAMTASLRGDSIFYVPGSVWRETAAGDGIQTVFNFVNGPAYKSTIAGADYYALSVTVDGVRKRLGTEYTNTSAGITFLTAPANLSNIAFVYGSGDASTYNQGVHTSTSPAGVRGYYIQLQLGNGAASYTDWFGVQSASVDWRVTLERDEEFGNPSVVAQDFDTPEVSGSITMKPRDVAALFSQVQKIAGITGTDIANATQDPPELEVKIIIKHPSTGAVLKTLHVPDGKFTMPSIQGQVGQKLEQDFSFTGASGVLQVFKGAMP
jgi:hypothetical protein